MLKEFKDFAVKGNMLDMAIGIVIGAAFGTVVKSLVDDIIMPIVGKVTGGVDFSKLAIDVGGVNIRYGSFIGALVSFIIVAFVLFMIVKNVNRFKKAEEEKPAAPPADVALLTEIRDLLQKQNG